MCTILLKIYEPPLVLRYNCSYILNNLPVNFNSLVMLKRRLQKLRVWLTDNYKYYFIIYLSIMSRADRV